MNPTHLQVQTSARDAFVEITDEVQRLMAPDLNPGWVHVYVPHTTAGITINENADPDVRHDMIKQLDLMVPWSQPFYRHGEGNSAAHVKASMMGSSVTVPIANGRLMLGQWQGIYLCEFDGPRTRRVIVSAYGNEDRD